METQGEQQKFEFGLGGLEYFSINDYKRMVWRRKWTIVCAMLIIALMTAVVTAFLPNRYRANTVILVDPRTVPENFVMSTATSAGVDRIASLREQILSNTRLSQIIDEMNLYSDLKNRLTQEEIITRMRQDIGVDVVATTNGDRGLGAFQITYTSKNPHQAAKVTNRLASLFIKENLETRQQQVLGTAEFIAHELDQANKDLQEKADKLREIKARHFAELPESQNIQLQALTSVQLEVRTEMDAINRDQQQKVYLESLMSEAAPVVNLDRGKPAEITELQTKLATLEAERDQLRTRYGAQFPDVLARTSDIEQVKRKISALEKSAAYMTEPPAANAHHNPVIESQIAAIDEDIQKRTAREVELNKQIAYQQSKLQLVPAMEQELAVATREYDTAMDQVRRLQDRKFAADLSSDMEDRQRGERFVVLDPAQAPEKPFEPNRPLIDALGLAAGLLVGIALAIGLEIFDPAVKTAREVGDQLNVPIFGEILWIATPIAVRRRLLRARMAVAGNTLLALTYLAVILAVSKFRG